MDRWMDLKNVVYMHIYSGILFSLTKEENRGICNKMCESWWHYAKWNELEKGKYCVISYVQSEKSYTHINSLGSWKPGSGGNGMLVKGYKLPVIGWIISEDLI